MQVVLGGEVMKLKMRKDIQQGAARHANHPFSEDTFGEWCGRACVNADAPEYLDALSVATVDMRGVATTCVTINGEFNANFARRAIAYEVGKADEMNAMNASWVGQESARCLVVGKEVAA